MCVVKGVNLWIEVDGGVFSVNAYKVIEVGVNVFVVGFVVFNFLDYVVVIVGIKVSKCLGV